MTTSPLRSAAGLVLAATLGNAPVASGQGPIDAQASIRITSHGVFHVIADDYAGAGFGAGYAQASEAICDIASRIVTVHAERSLYFGPGERTHDFLNDPTNLDSDFFWQRIHDVGVIDRELALDPPLGPSAELREMIRGFAAGYNRYLATTGVAKLPDERCRGKAWVRPITEKDLYLRALHWNLFRSGGMMLTQLVAAAPPGAGSPRPGGDLLLMDDLIRAERAHGYGSNMMTLGGEATDNGQGMLFANPHWTWAGSDRWMEMQLTIPGKLNVIGMQTLGLPVVQTGFNEHTAWAGTTSMPMRYTLARLELGATPTSYLVDGRERAMTPRTVRVKVRDRSGKVATRDHTFWETDVGLLIVDPAFTWTEHTAYAMRDVGYSVRWLSQQLRLNGSRSAHDLSESGKQYMAIGWRNLSATDDQGNVFYGDRTAVPAVTDSLRAACEVEKLSAEVLVLDGRRSACGWRVIPGAPVPGIFSANELPMLERRDYIIQSNDSHWLNNLRQPLEGWPSIMGSERTPRDFRTRHALAKVEGRLAGTDGYPGNRFSLNLLKIITMNNRVLSADVWLDEVARFCDDQTDPRLVAAGRIIRTWDRTDNLDSHGALLWRHFAENLMRLDPRGQLFTVGFDLKDPVGTPRGLRTEDPRVREAMLRAIGELEDAGIPLDASVRNYQYTQKGARRIPIAGGSGELGQYNALWSPWSKTRGPGPIEGGATFIMWMQFTPAGPVGESILTFSQSPIPTSPHYADQTLMWSEMRTKKMLFREADILADPELKTIAICSGSSCRGAGHHRNPSR